MEACPQCNGFGEIMCFNFKCPTLPCPMCNGSGKVDDRYILWRKRGAILKKKRIEMGLTLRKAAAVYGIDPAYLSRMERGLLSPHPYYL